MDTVFRSKSQDTAQSPEEEIASVSSKVRDTVIGPHDTSSIEVPYTDYIKAHNHPHAVDYFKLGDHWDTPDGGYGQEVSIIEEYLQSKVEHGEIANTVSAIKNELKTMEKINNLKLEERTPIKIGTIAAYVRFLMDTDNIKYNMRKYGYSK